MSLMTSKKFVYNGTNCEEYDCIIGSFDSIDYKSETGNTRTVQKDELNMVSKHVNTYGTVYDNPITFKFSILRCDGKPFTQSESLRINEWLLGPSTPKFLKFEIEQGDLEYDEYDIHYYAICTSVEDEVFNGLVGKTLTFETNSSYGYMNKSITSLTCTDIIQANIFNPCIDDNSDYYPILTIKSDGIVSITNLTTGIKYTYDLSDLTKKEIVVDNYHTKIKSGNSLISLSKIGWTEDDIKWLYLKSGQNKLKIEGNCTVLFETEYPRKVGLL